MWNIGVIIVIIKIFKVYQRDRQWEGVTIALLRRTCWLENLSDEMNAEAKLGDRKGMPL